jgi:hypothetical protein
MKIKLAFLLFLVFVVSGCKDDIEEMIDETLITDGTVLFEGSLTGSGNYNVRGIVTIIEKNGQKSIQFENFSSSSGPDLKVFISNEIRPTNGIGLGALKALSGNFSYPLPTTFDFDTTGPFVLIYCEQFTVLFGSTRLEPKGN